MIYFESSQFIIAVEETMKMIFMMITILCFKVIADNIVDIIMFYDFKNSKITRFD